MNGKERIRFGKALRFSKMAQQALRDLIDTQDQTTPHDRLSLADAELCLDEAIDALEAVKP